MSSDTHQESFSYRSFPSLLSELQEAWMFFSFIS